MKRDCSAPFLCEMDPIEICGNHSVCTQKHATRYRKHVLFQHKNVYHAKCIIFIFILH